jgi:hypothetical protein
MIFGQRALTNFVDFVTLEKVMQDHARIKRMATYWIGRYCGHCANY